MSLTSRKDFLDKFFCFKQTLSVLTEIKEEVIEIVLFRFHPDKVPKMQRGIFVTPFYTWVSRPLFSKFKDSQEFWKELDLSEKPTFQKVDRLANSFDRYQIVNEYSKVTWEMKENYDDYMIKLDTVISSYSMVCNRREEESVRFYPTFYEREWYNHLLKRFRVIKSPIGYIQEENMLEKMRESDKVLEKVSSFYEWNYMRRAFKDEKEEIMTLEDAKTFYDTELQFSLSSKNMNTWMRARHNLFGISVLRELRKTEPLRFDLDLEEEFGYRGMFSHKTPDYYLVEDDTTYLIDFAVTVGNMLEVHDKKMRNYEDMAEDMSIRLSRSFKAVSVVWQINEGMVFLLPDFLESVRVPLSNSTILKDILLIHNQISSMENYSFYSKNLDLDLDEDHEDLEDKIGSYVDLLSSFLNLYTLKDKMTYDTMDSRRECTTKKMKKFEDMDIFQELVSTRKEDEVTYRAKLKRSLKRMILDEKIPKHMESVFSRDNKKISALLENSLMNQERIRDQVFLKNSKIPKMMKFAFLNLMGKDSKAYIKYTPMFFNYERETEDGTLFINSSFYKDQDSSQEYLEDGLGVSVRDDTQLMDNLYTFLAKNSQMETERKEAFCLELAERPFYKELVSTNLWAIVTMLADLMENISYMEGRRFLFDERKGHSVMKSFGSYVLMIRKGSKLTASKQINYKILCKKENHNMMESEIFHGFTEFNDEYMETRWLTISITDIRHFLKAREVCMSLASDYYDKKMESSRNMAVDESIMDKSFMTSILVYLEHRRGTSTTLQLNRYLLHSSSAYMSNKEKLVEDINSNPIRSRLEAYVRICQCKWFDRMLLEFDDLNFSRVEKMMSYDTDYDRVYFPSFFDLSLTMEFGMMMNEMYLCNLFDKESGFADHRMKQIVEKMTQAEIHFQKVKKSKESMGLVENMEEFWMKKDELHLFDKNFVMAATKSFFKKKANQLLMLDAMMVASTDVIDSAMMMTASLVGGDYKSKVLITMSKIKKTKSFLSLYDLLQELPNHLLLSMVSEEDIIEAVFTIFPKAQIGGPREILIQSVMLRVMVKFLETMSLRMCEKHSKEMITKDKKKAEIQSSQMNSMKDVMMTLKKRGVASMSASFNSDATKWSPGFVMEHFLHFIFNWETDSSLKNFLCTVVSSFSHKVILTPDMLKEKWRRKPREQKEASDSVEAFRTMSEKAGGAPVLESGMGQGMFHKLSSLYHVIMDDYIDDMLKEVLEDEFSTGTKCTSMISSDDKTKMLLFTFKDYKKSDEALKYYLLLLDCCYRLCNIHTNWKKSGLHFIITEFNSLFSIGKRMLWATVKDLYTANSIPDLTSPEEAVKEVLSSVRRCLEHGVYLPTLEVILSLARNQLMRYYRIDQELKSSLCKKLNCQDTDLPYQLGFVPVRWPIETLIFGPDFHMFLPTNSQELNDFFTGLYSANSDKSIKRSRHYIPFDETGAGKFWIELPTRMDKRLMEMKNDFYKEKMDKTHEETVMELNLRSMDVNLSSQDWFRHRNFQMSYFIGMNRKYEFQETMVVHSLVRALQMSKRKCSIFPPTQEEVELDDIINNDSNTKEERRKARLDKKFFYVDLMGFVDRCIGRSNEKSSLSLMSGYKNLVSVFEEAKCVLSSLIKSTRFTHSSMRELRFNSEDYRVSFSKDDLINFIFDKTSDFRNSTMKSFTRMCEVLGKPMSKMWSNPFKFIREVMHDQEYCYKSFMEFINFQSKMSGNVRIRMLSDFPDSGNILGNLVNLYRGKMDPRYIFDYPSNVKLADEDSLFLTKMSFKEWKGASDKNKVPHINLEDRDVARTRKLAFRGMSTDVRFGSVVCNRLFYQMQTDRANNLTWKVWSDLSFLAVAKEYSEKGVKKILMSVRAQDRESVEENKNFMPVKRYLSENSLLDIKYETKNFRSEDGSYLYSVNSRNLYYRVDPVYMMTEYKVFLQVYFQDNPKKISRKFSFFLMKDPYSFSSRDMSQIPFAVEGIYSETLLSALSNPPPILVLDKILLDYGWIKEKLFEEEETWEEEEHRASEISSIINQFSKDSVMDMIPGQFWDLKDSLGQSGDLQNASLVTTEEFSMTDVFMNTLSKLQQSIKKGMEDDSLEMESKEAHEMDSIMRVVEKIVRASCRMMIRLDKEKIKSFMEGARKNMIQFTNLMIWVIKDTFPSISDTLTFMVYHILMKDVSPEFIPVQFRNIRISQPSEFSVRTLRSKRLIDVVSQGTRDVERDILSDF